MFTGEKPCHDECSTLDSTYMGSVENQIGNSITSLIQLIQILQYSGCNIYTKILLPLILLLETRITSKGSTIVIHYFQSKQLKNKYIAKSQTSVTDSKISKRRNT